MSKVVIIGPGHPLRGGLATFNQRLCQAFIEEGHDCSICSFSLQYPGIFFPGKTQYSSEPPPRDMKIRSLINTINPINWLRVGRLLSREKPDIIVVRFWIPYIGPSLGTILRLVKKNRHTKIICIADNVIPHERRPGDRTLTRYFLNSCEAFVTMSEKVKNDLMRFRNKKPVKLVHHPLYDNFGQSVPKAEARLSLGIAANEKLVLFFGFIRHYKGLDILLRAMADDRIRNSEIKLMIAGEFYEDERKYRDLIEKLGIANNLILKTKFIADHEVKNYLCAADVVIQPYRAATQSGVTPLAYHFEKPMIVTNVGGLPSLVPHERSGLVCEPDERSIAGAILRFYQLGDNYFIPHLREEKKKYSWVNMVNAITSLANDLS